MIVSQIVQQHADDAAALATTRLSLTRSAYAKLPRLRRADQRLGAHLDGLRAAGVDALRFCESALESPSPGAMFVLTVLALEEKSADRLTRLIAVSQAVPHLVDGLLSAFEWVERSRLQGMVVKLLRARDAFARMLGIAACAAHRVDPGIAAARYHERTECSVRAEVFRAAGELGIRELDAVCAAAMRGDCDVNARFWATWSAVMLGDRGAGLDALAAEGLAPGPHRARAFRLALQALTARDAHRVLQDVAADPARIRWLIEGSGLAGDPTYVPWLIQRMADVKTARLAAEAFALITGVDLGQDALDAPAPEDREPGPTDDPDDPNVDMDPDDGLNWPDGAKIEGWWTRNSIRFRPGTRYFMGAPVTRERCIDVLKTGYQRQRILAAHYLCLLEPGTPLFNTSAPAWRQQRWLAKM